MYAAVSGGRLLYAGNSLEKACEACKDVENAKMVEFQSWDEIPEIVSDSLESTEEDLDLEQAFSDALNDVVQKLNDMGVNEDLPNKLLDVGGKILADIKLVGSNGVKTVGEGFIALGELLRGSDSK